MLLIRIDGTWSRLFADERLFFFSETTALEALRETANGFDLRKHLGWPAQARVTRLSYGQGMLVLITDAGAVTLFDEHGSWRLTRNLP